MFKFKKKLIDPQNREVAVSGKRLAKEYHYFQYGDFLIDVVKVDEGFVLLYHDGKRIRDPRISAGFAYCLGAIPTREFIEVQNEEGLVKTVKEIMWHLPRLANTSEQIRDDIQESLAKKLYNQGLESFKELLRPSATIY